MNHKKYVEVIEKIQMDDLTKQRIVNKCINKQRKTIELFRYSRILIAASISICTLASIPIIASVTTTILERMQLMDQKEIKYLNEMVQEQKSESDSFSREFTKDEKNRKILLLEEYINEGRFPKGEIKVTDIGEQKIKEELWYDTENSIFYLPERELSNEELLQIIEFNEKRDYSLQVSNELEKPIVRIVDNMNVMEKAQYVIETIYGITTRNMENIIEYDENTNQYNIIFTGDEKEFSIRMEKENLRINAISTDFKKDIDNYKIVNEETAKNEKIIFEKSKDILKNIFNVDREIKNVWCNYFIGDGGRGQDRKIHYLFELEDGTGYIFRYIQETETLYEFTYISSFNGYQTMMQNNDPKDLERGIIRKKFEVDFK